MERVTGWRHFSSKFQAGISQFKLYSSCQSVAVPTVSVSRNKESIFHMILSNKETTANSFKEKLVIRLLEGHVHSDMAV